MIGRFAPTPSGRLHLGNIACAMLAWLSARHQGGQILLRIEDVDVPRCPPRLVRQCVSDLAWLGFRWDGEILYQSERGDIYAQALQSLTARGLTYPCFCTRAQLHPEHAPNLGDTIQVYAGTCAALAPAEVEALRRLRQPAIRLRVPDEVIRFQDVLCGEVSENLKTDCGDFVLRRSDGLFGYQLAAVVDDALTGVTEVVRGRDILTSTPRQIYLQRLLDAPTPTYAHIPLLVDAQSRRLAKRDGDIGLETLAKKHTPQQLIGLLAAAIGLLAEPRPTTLDALAQDFSWEKVRGEMRFAPMEA